MAKKPKNNVDLTNKNPDFDGTKKIDIVQGTEGVNEIHGGLNNDKLFGNGGDDFIYGEEGIDKIDGGEGNDFIEGGEGNDKIDAGAGTNTVDGGEGTDRLTLDGTFAEAKITKSIDGLGYTITTKSGAVTTATNVELFKFSDGIKLAKDLIPVDPTTGKTFVLTDKVDGPGAVAPSIDTTGTVGNDTYIGATGTLTSADVIDGGAGIDTLTFRDSSAGVTVAPKLTNVEIVNTSAIGTGAVVFNLAGSTGMTKLINEGSSQGLKYDNVAKIAALELSGVTAGATEIAYAAAAVAGAADVQTISLNNVAATGTGIVVNGVETTAITATGVNSTTALTTGAAKVTIEGAGSFAVVNAGVAQTLTGATSIDGSKATGALTFAIDGAKDVTATGGTGDDTIGAGNTALTVLDKIDGGAGKDFVQFLTGATLPAAAVTNILNFEGVAVNDASAGAAINVSNFTGSTLTDFRVGLNVLNNDGLNAGAVTITNAATGSTITQYDDAEAAVEGTVSLALKTDGAADTLTYNLFNTDNDNAVTTNLVGLTSLTATGIETLNLNFGSATIAGTKTTADNTFAIASLVAAATTTLNVVGDFNVTLGTAASTLTALTTVDASKVTGNVTLGQAGNEFATAATGATITTGAGDDSVFLNVGNTGVLGALDLGANPAASVVGDTLTLTGGAALTGASVIDLSSATDQIQQLFGGANVAAQKGIENINVSGAGAATATYTVTGSAANNTITTGAASDVLSGGGGDDRLVANGGADNVTGGTGNDTFVFLTTADTRNASYAGGNTTAVNIDRVTDFTGNAALTGDRFEIDSAVALNFNAGATATVTTATVANAADIDAIFAGAAGVASTAANAQVYDITVTAGTLAGRYLIVNDATAALANTDTIINITGAVGTIDASDFLFV